MNGLTIIIGQLGFLSLPVRDGKKECKQTNY